MRCGRGRIIQREWLDQTPAPQARASLADLVRINRLLGWHEVIRKTFRDLVGPAGQFTVLDVGAASGDMGAVIRSEFPLASVTSFDYKLDHLERAPQPRVCGDAFRLPFTARAFDFVFCSLFLHHFSDDAVVELLHSFGRIARRNVVATDLERNILAYYFLPATRWLFRWDRITLHDGPISVEAAFHPEELQALAERAALRVRYVRAYRPAYRLVLVGDATD